jgi:glucose/arabinose dehydrogenase
MLVMLRRLALLVSCVAIAGCSAGHPGGAAPPTNAATSATAAGSFRVVRYQGRLDFPVDMAWVPGSKKLFFTEKATGKVRVMVRGRLLRRACVNLDVNAAGERGALGIALRSHFRSNHQLYVYYTNASPLENRVTRFTVIHNRCRRAKAIVRHLSASSSGYHNGGQLEFVHGRLFVTTGEAHDPANAQSLSTRLGKLLRLRPGGKIPRGNPLSKPGARSPIWTFGHRNPFGLTHKPGTRLLIESENGPSCDDELNRIEKGRNYGWGVNYQCGTRGVGPNPKGPLVRWTPTIVPTDPWWYRGRLKTLSGSVYMGDYSSGRLHRFHLDRTGRHVLSQSVIYNAPEGIVDVSKGPGGWLYFLTPTAIYRLVSS